MRLLKILARLLIPGRYHTELKDLYLRLRSLPYLGDRFVCPGCGGHFRKFLTRGVKPRPNAECPRCASLERHRLLWFYLERKTNLFSDNLKVLHFAPEHTFQMALRKLPNLHYLSADLTRSTAMTRMDVTSIPCPDDTFDVVLCNHVLEHVRDDKKALREIFRILKPGGWAILQSPVDRDADETVEDPGNTSPEDRRHLFGQADHVRLYGRDYRERLEEAGFVVRVENYAAELTEVTKKRHSLLDEEDIYMGLKPAKKCDDQLSPPERQIT